MKRGAKTAEELIEDTKAEIDSLDAQMLRLANATDESSLAEHAQLQRMKAFHLNRIKQLEKSVRPYAQGVPRVSMAPSASSSTESTSDSPSGSPRQENSPRHYYESAQAAAAAAKASASDVTSTDRRQVLGRKMGKAVHEGMALYSEQESKASINIAVLNAIEFLEILEQVFKNSFGPGYDLYKPNGPIEMNLRGVQTEGVEASTSGRLFARTDYFIKAHDDVPKSFGTIDTLKGLTREGNPFHFESTHHVQVLKEMITSGKATPEEADRLLQNIVDLIEADPHWNAFWHQRSHIEDNLRQQILDTFVYKIAGECHKKLIDGMPRERQAELDAFMQKLKLSALHFTSSKADKPRTLKM